MGGKNKTPLIGPFEGIDEANQDFFFICEISLGVLYNRLLALARVPEVLGRSGDLVGTVSTYPGTSPTPW